MERHERGVEMLHAPSAPLSHLLAELESCTAERLTVQMEYRKGSGDSVSARAVDPYGLVLWKGRWYLAGYCHQRREVRSFRVDRIAGLDRTGTGFLRPPEFSARQFLLRSLLPGEDQETALIPVVIASSEEVLNDLCSHWLFGHSLEQRTPGEACFLLDEASLYGFAAYFLLPYGKALTILEPAALKQKLAAVAAGISAHYTES
jgi:predicted DNA-binding transcriptional regulator YafY